MRNTLPARPQQNECAIVNLDSNEGAGTHWVAYCKRRNSVYYFDSFGNLPPPMELIRYLGSGAHIIFNYKKYQDYGSVVCGQLCLNFLYEMYNKTNRFKIKKNQNYK